MIRVVAQILEGDNCLSIKGFKFDLRFSTNNGSPSKFVFSTATKNFIDKMIIFFHQNILLLALKWNPKATAFLNEVEVYIYIWFQLNPLAFFDNDTKIISLITAINSYRVLDTLRYFPAKSEYLYPLRQQAAKILCDKQKRQ